MRERSGVGVLSSAIIIITAADAAVLLCCYYLTHLRDLHQHGHHHAVPIRGGGACQHTHKQRYRDKVSKAQTQTQRLQRPSGWRVTQREAEREAEREAARKQVHICARLPLPLPPSVCLSVSLTPLYLLSHSPMRFSVSERMAHSSMPATPVDRNR